MSKRISVLSLRKEIFDSVAPVYQQTPNAGYEYKMKYEIMEKAMKKKIGQTNKKFW